MYALVRYTNDPFGTAAFGSPYLSLRVEFTGMGENSESDKLTPWEALPMQRQLELRETYGHYLDSLPPTCSMETKIERFRRWLEEQGVGYSA